MNPSLRAAAAAATLGSDSSTPCFWRRIPVACGVDSALADHRLDGADLQHTRLPSPPFPSSRPTVALAHHPYSCCFCRHIPDGVGLPAIRFHYLLAPSSHGRCKEPRRGAACGSQKPC